MSEATADIAIVGMAAQLPGAPGVDAYWQMLRDGVSAIRPLSEADLEAACVDAATRAHPDYVPYSADLDGFAEFDADFFGLSPKEAAIMDPQHRKFLETSWQALENAALMPERFEGPIGVYAGCGMGSYFYFNICSNRDLVDGTGMFLLRHTGNDKDFLSTRLSHFLDLKGPSVSVQTACSTSLVAAHYAAQSLLNGECDLALAGGVTIDMPQGQGYLFRENEILSPDGECHAFDHRAQGTVFGSGAGVVVLRRLEDAIADGDHIWAVIKGSAVNNDGSDKAGYLAPSVGGQAAAVAEAQALAGVRADSVDYVECHGTGTYLGDPIEVAALTEAFRETTQARDFCRIGSVKTNIGHLDTAAGAASLIKTALALHHKQMPPSLGYEAPNPAIDFENSPFSVNAELTDWPLRGSVRRAGVNSLGVGGTNAHLVVDEAPLRAPSEPSDWPFQLITVSGRNKAALDANTAALAEYLEGHPECDLADVAYTLWKGRCAFERRRVVVASDAAEAAAKLRRADPRDVFTHRVREGGEAVFMFPGGGAQYAGMACDLYETEPVFAQWMDAGLTVLEGKIDYDIRALWLPALEDGPGADERLKTPSVQLPLIMIVEYALAKLLQSWGIEPDHLIGHSMGENTAAAVAGVMRFEDCISLVHLRGTLFDTVPAGGMLSVSMPAAELEPLLGDALDLGAINGPGLSVASGPQEALDALQEQLQARGVDYQRIAIDIAAHSRMLEPILERFGDYLRAIPLTPPEIPIISNRTGQALSDAEATDPDYWVAHLRGTVRFADGISTLAAVPGRIFIEVGPGKALSSLSGQNVQVEADQVVNVLRHPDQDVADDAYFMSVLGRLWACGLNVDWSQIWGEARRNRVVLPGYQFQRSRYFIDAAEGQAATQVSSRIMRSAEISEWGYAPLWRKAYADCLLDIAAGDLGAPQSWLIFADEAGVAAPLIARLRAGGHSVTEVHAGDAFARLGPHSYALAPEQGRAGYDQLIHELIAGGQSPARIAHFWSVTDQETHRPGSSFFHRSQEQGFYSLMFLAQAISAEALPVPLHISVFSSGAQAVAGQPLPHPGKATLAGPVGVIPAELPGVTVSWCDLSMPKAAKRGWLSAPSAAPPADQSDALLEELLSTPANGQSALRDGLRYAQELMPRALAGPAQEWEPGDAPVVLVTGGFGGIGQTLAADLMTQNGAKIALVSRKVPRLDDPADPRAAALAALRDKGEVIVLQGDVCNAADMARVRGEVEERFGRVTGVIHAAGVIDDAPILSKTAGAVEAVFTPKIHGTKVLGETFPDGDLDWMVLFSSSSTATTPAGQIDYVAANSFLSAYAEARKGGATRVIALGWGVWSGVGMAADAMADRLGERRATPPRPAGQALLERVETETNTGRHIFSSEISAARHWVLDEHRTKDGVILMPGTGYIELARQALRALDVDEPFAIRDLYFLRALDVDPGESREIRLRLTPSDAGFDFEVLSAAQVDGKDAWQRHAEARIVLAPQAAPDAFDIEGFAQSLGSPSAAQAGSSLSSPQEAHLSFGPRWRVLQSMALGAGRGLAQLELPAEAAGDIAAGYGLHPALLDLATGWAMQLIEGYEAQHLWVPLSYEEISVYRDLPPRIVSAVTAVEMNGEDAVRFDLTLATPEGAVCMVVRGFSIRRLDDLRLGRAPAPLANEVEFDAAAVQPLSEAEERLRHNISQGIKPGEGAEAFRRVMAGDYGAQIIVSSLDLPALKAQNALQDAGAAAMQGFERPDLDSDFAPPETDIERSFAALWQDLLGVSEVGIDDSFFDLGGHSLIAVRLFAQVKKTYHIDFPISVLFEAATIRKLAALVEAQIGPQEDRAEAPAEPPAQERRYSYLVPMHEGAAGEKRPFFLVAGMFGNVLNLRHLAQLLGRERPFYGLQARGLYGGDAPHTSIEEAARDYIEEMRMVQPEGPYLLGGFSGGGITAYEITRQLEAAGQEVALLVLLDTPLPTRRPLALVDRLHIQASELRKGGVLYPLRWIGRRVTWELNKRFASAEATASTHQFHNAEIEAAFIEAVTAYQVRPWDGNLHLYRPPLVGHWAVSGGKQVNSERAYVLHDNDWSQYARALEVFEVPGDHDSMVLEPNVRVLADKLRNAIRDAEPRGAARATKIAAE